MSEELIRVNDEQAREVGLPSPAALDYMMSVANMLITSNLLGPDLEPSKETIGSLVAAKWPQAEIDLYRDKVVKSNALAKMLIGREMSMNAMESLQDISIVKGKMFVHYSQLLGQMERKGYTCTWVERSNERAALKVVRNGEELLFEFTIEDARRAGLLDCAEDKRKYNQYYLRPRVMLTARVASEAYRTTGGRANVYTPEEKQEVLGSTMDAPNGDDARRTEALQEKYRVAVKPETEPPAANVAETPKREPEPEPVVEFRVCEIQGEGLSKHPVVLKDEPPCKRPEEATLRARALANTKRTTHTVVKSVNGKFVGEEVSICNPPATSGQMNRVPPKDEAPAPAPAAPVAPDPVDPVVPAPTPAKPSALKQRMIDLTEQIEKTVNNGLAEDKKIPLKTVAGRVKTFLLGYFGVAKLADLPTTEKPADVQAYEHAFSDLTACASQDANVLLSAPEDAGKRMAADTRHIQALLQVELQWSQDAIPLAFRLARLRGLTANDLMLFLQNVRLVKMLDGGKMRSQDPANIQAALRLCLVSREAGKLCREATDHNISIADCLTEMERSRFKGQPVESASPEDVTSAIRWVIEGIQAEAAAPAPTPPAPPAPPTPPAPPAAGPDEMDTLFDSLP